MPHLFETAHEVRAGPFDCVWTLPGGTAAVETAAKAGAFNVLAHPKAEEAVAFARQAMVKFAAVPVNAKQALPQTLAMDAVQAVQPNGAEARPQAAAMDATPAVPPNAAQPLSQAVAMDAVQAPLQYGAVAHRQIVPKTRAQAQAQQVLQPDLELEYVADHVTQASPREAMPHHYDGGAGFLCAALVQALPPNTR